MQNWQNLDKSKAVAIDVAVIGAVGIGSKILGNWAKAPAAQKVGATKVVQNGTGSDKVKDVNLVGSTTNSEYWTQSVEFKGNISLSKK